MFTLRTSELEQASDIEWLLERSDWDSYTIASHDYMQMVAIAGYGRYVRFYRMHHPGAQILPTSFHFIRKLHYLSRAELLAVVGNGRSGVLAHRLSISVFG